MLLHTLLSSSTFTRSTVQKHLNKDLQKRAQQQPRTDSALRAFVDGCISRNQAYLATGKTQNVPGGTKVYYFFFWIEINYSGID